MSSNRSISGSIRHSSRRRSIGGSVRVIRGSSGISSISSISSVMSSGNSSNIVSSNSRFRKVVKVPAPPDPGTDPAAVLVIDFDATGAQLLAQAVSRHEVLVEKGKARKRKEERAEEIGGEGEEGRSRVKLRVPERKFQTRTQRSITDARKASFRASFVKSVRDLVNK